MRPIPTAADVAPKVPGGTLTRWLEGCDCLEAALTATRRDVLVHGTNAAAPALSTRNLQAGGEALRRYLLGPPGGETWFDCAPRPN